jgi:hypothetical protein
MEERKKMELEESEARSRLVEDDMRKAAEERKGRQERGEEMKVTVSYNVENWATHQVKPESMEFVGANMAEISDEVVRHFVDLEMNGGTEVAKDVKIKTPEGEMTFEELAAKSKR